MKIAERPVLMPAQTLFGTTTGPVVDTEVILINGGRVYLSRTEVWSAAALMPDVVEGIASELGWAPPTLFNEMKARVDELEQQLTEAQSDTPKVITLDTAREIFADLTPGAA